MQKDQYFINEYSRIFDFDRVTARIVLFTLRSLLTTLDRYIQKAESFDELEKVVLDVKTTIITVLKLDVVQKVGLASDKMAQFQAEFKRRFTKQQKEKLIPFIQKVICPLTNFVHDFAWLIKTLRQRIAGIQQQQRSSIKDAQGHDEEEECPICLEPQTNCVTACGHHFHKQCIIDWKQKQNDCPSCRRDLSDVQYTIENFKELLKSEAAPYEEKIAIIKNKTYDDLCSAQDLYINLASIDF